MNFEDLQKLMANFNDSQIKELEVDLDGAHVHLSKNNAPFPPKMSQQPVAPVAAPVATPAPAASVSTAPAQAVADSTKGKKNKDDGAKIESPMVGTIYLQPKPGQPTYVKVGDHVKKGDVVCVIEAMKMMTEVKSKLSGTITKVLVENEDLVEFGQALFAVAED